MKEINVRELKESPVKLIADDWSLVASGGREGFNVMTVSWGAVGELWGRDVVFIFIRPQRYTFKFMEKNDIFTLSFFGGEFKDALRFCGSNSGKDVDKAAACGLTPSFLKNGGVAFEEAKYTIVCRKLASQFIDPAGFADPSVESVYPDKDYHKIYVGEILKVYSD